MNESMEYALKSIIWYDGHEEWLEELAEELEKTDKFVLCPFGVDRWQTEEHCIWMLLVGMFGEWGTSIRGGWIEQNKECATYIRKLLAELKAEEEGEIVG